MMRFIKYEGNFFGINVYSNPLLKEGRAFTTGKVIFIGRDQIWNNPKRLYILQHEFGHCLQYKEWGGWKFLRHIAIPSLKSAIWNSPSAHNRMDFEMDANRRAYQFFGQPEEWNFTENPIS